MKVDKINNTQFNGLHVTPETLKKIGCTRKTLLNNPSIKDCAEKYDVLVTAGQKKYVVDRHDGFTKDKYLPTAYILGVIWSAPHLGEWLTALGVTNPETMLGVCAGVMGLTIISIIKLVTQRINEINIQGASKVEKYDGENFNAIYYDEMTTRGAQSKVYTVRRNNDGIIENIPNIAKEVQDKENQYFYWSAVSDAKLDDMFTPSKYLKELQKMQKSAKEFYIDDVFKFPINKGGDTLLTAFFDVAIPDKNDEKEMDAYYKILREISKTDKRNFDQRDAHGITILEKIMNSENEYVLPLLKGSKFSYSPFLKYAYDNIQNKTFKQQLKLSIDFNFNLLEKSNENPKNRWTK